MERICITGTGRCGTTFLMRLLSLLEIDTGYSPQDILSGKDINKNCNAGLEGFRDNTPIPRVIKSPYFIVDHSMNHYYVKKVILLVRDYDSAASSRAKIGLNKRGGLWMAGNKKEQIEIYEECIANFIIEVAKQDLELHLIYFDKMISDKNYLYDKLKPLFPDIDRARFEEAYLLATDLSRPRR